MKPRLKLLLCIISQPPIVFKMSIPFILTMWPLKSESPNLLPYRFNDLCSSEAGWCAQLRKGVIPNAQPEPKAGGQETRIQHTITVMMGMEGKYQIHTFHGYKNRKLVLVQVLQESHVKWGLNVQGVQQEKFLCERKWGESHTRLVGPSDHHANLTLREGEREGRSGRSVLNCCAIKGRLSKPLGSPKPQSAVEASPVLQNGLP